jgi:hypothetical protein
MSRFALAALATFIVLAPAAAAGPYDDLLPYVPSHCNTLMLLNVKAAYDSPLAKNEKWADNVLQRYRAGLGFVPPDARAVVVSSQMNMTNMTRDHQFGLVRVTSLPSTRALAEREGGTQDVIADMGVVLSPRNMYVTTVGAPAVALVYPANRQAMARWLRHAKTTKGQVDMAPYLKKAADNAGGDVLTVALDLSESVDPTLLRMGLAVSPIVVNRKIQDLDRLSRFIASVQGLTFSAKVGETITGSVTIDFAFAIAAHQKPVHDLFLELLEDQGVVVPGMEQWKTEYGANSMTLSGPLTTTDLRHIFSLFQFPGLGTQEDPKAEGEPNAPATQRYLRAVDTILGDLGGKKDSTDYVRTATWREKAAGQIEGLSRNGVDPIASEAAFDVAKRVRAIADTIRGVPVDVKAIESKAYYHSTPNWSVGIGWWGRPNVIWNPNGGSVSTNHQQIQEERAKAIAEGESKRLQLSSQINDIMAEAKKKLGDKYKAPF